MFAYPGKSISRRLLPVALAVVVISACMEPLAFARILVNTIDPVGTIQGNGRQLTVTGPIQCTSGETLDIRATVTQRETGALAEGQTRFTCSGELQHWLIDASTRSRETFQNGPATGSAVGITSDRGKSTDAHQWLVNITLVSQ